MMNGWVRPSTCVTVALYYFNCMLTWSVAPFVTTGGLFLTITLCCSVFYSPLSFLFFDRVPILLIAPNRCENWTLIQNCLPWMLLQTKLRLKATSKVIPSVQRLPRLARSIARSPFTNTKCVQKKSRNPVLVLTQSFPPHARLLITAEDWSSREDQRQCMLQMHQRLMKAFSS